jgi:hypothetical protein
MPALPNKNDFNRGFRRNETSLNNTNREQLLRLQQKALTQPLYNNNRVLNKLPIDEVTVVGHSFPPQILPPPFVPTGATSLSALSWVATNPGAIQFSGAGDTVSFVNGWQGNPSYLVATSSDYVATYSNTSANSVTIQCGFTSGPAGGNDFSSPSYGGLAFGSYTPSNFGVMFYVESTNPPRPSGFTGPVYPTVTQNLVVPGLSNIQIFIRSVHLYDSSWTGTVHLSLI